MRMADTPNDPDTGCSSEPKSSGAGSGHSRRGQRRSGPQLSGARHRRRAGPRVLPNREPANIAIACLPSPPFGGRSRSTGRYAALFSNPYTTFCIVPVDARGIDDALLDGCRTAAALMLSRCGRHGQRLPRPGRFGRMSACPDAMYLERAEALLLAWPPPASHGPQSAAQASDRNPERLRAGPVRSMTQGEPRCSI